MKIISLYPVKKWQFDTTLISTWGFALVALSFSFYQQYIMQLEPCYLCQLQRLPFLAILLITPIGLLENFNYLIKRFIQLFFLISLITALYHILIQFGVIDEKCDISQAITSTEDFYLLLIKTPVSCAKTNWKFLGLPITIYNLIFSIGWLIFYSWNIGIHKKTLDNR